MWQRTYVLEKEKDKMTEVLAGGERGENDLHKSDEQVSNMQK